MRDVLFIILLAVGICDAREAPKEWGEWLLEGRSLLNAGNYSAAAHAFREALATADHSDIAATQLVEIRDALAGAYAEAGQYSESEGEYRRELALIEKSEGQASVNYALVLGSIAILPTQTNIREEVIVRLRETIAENIRRPAVKNLVRIHVCLALVLRKQKRYQEEESLLLDALADVNKLPTREPGLMSAIVNDLAVLRWDQGRYQESVDLQQRSIRVLEAALGGEHPSLIVPLSNLATTYVKMGRFDDACITYEKAIDLCGKTLGEDDLDYAVLLENYGLALRKLGRKREAEKADSKGRQIQRAVNRRNGIGSTINVSSFHFDREAGEPPH